MVNDWVLKMVAAIAGTAFLVAVLAAVAYGHGPHHSPVKPAYDCFKYWNTETRTWHSTEGDYEYTSDEDLDVFILWKCTCEWYQHGQRYVCRWVEVARHREITKLPKPESFRPGDQFRDRYRTRAWVKWLAWHGSNCYMHWDKRRVRVLERRGSERRVG